MLKRIAVALVCTLSLPAFAQWQLNPRNQVNWGALSGTAAPTSTSPGYCGNTATGTTTSGAATVSSMSSVVGIVANQTVTGTGIPANTTVLSVNQPAGTITLSQNATASGTGVTLTFYALGMPFTDTTNSASYHCGPSGWFGGNAGLFPSNIYVIVEGSSIDAGYNDQGDAYISAQSAGTGYSGTGTVGVTVASGSCTTAPAVSALVNPSGGLTFALTNVGQGCIGATFTTAISGFTGGSGASVSLTAYPNPYTSPWWLQFFSMPSLAGKVSGYHNYAVSGATVSDVLGRFTSNGYAAICGSTSHKNYFLMDGGAFDNSIANGTTYDATFTQWESLYGALRAAGCHVIVATPQNRGAQFGVQPSVFYQQMDKLAALISGSIQPGDYLLDWYNALPNTNVNPYSWTGLHFTGQGATFVAGVSDNELTHGNPYQNAGSAINRQVVPLALDLTGLTGNVGEGTQFVTINVNGIYQVSCYEVVTTGGSAGSTLPQFQTAWTDNDTGAGVPAWVNFGASAVTTNTVGASNAATLPINSAGNHVIYIATTGYSGTNTYNLHCSFDKQ